MQVVVVGALLAIVFDPGEILLEHRVKRLDLRTDRIAVAHQLVESGFRRFFGFSKTNLLSADGAVPRLGLLAKKGLGCRAIRLLPEAVKHFVHRFMHLLVQGCNLPGPRKKKARFRGLFRNGRYRTRICDLHDVNVAL